LKIKNPRTPLGTKNSFRGISFLKTPVPKFFKNPLA